MAIEEGGDGLSDDFDNTFLPLNYGVQIAESSHTVLEGYCFTPEMSVFDGPPPSGIQLPQIWDCMMTKASSKKQPKTDFKLCFSICKQYTCVNMSRIIVVFKSTLSRKTIRVRNESSNATNEMCQ